MRFRDKKRKIKEDKENCGFSGSHKLNYDPKLSRRANRKLRRNMEAQKGGQTK